MTIADLLYQIDHLTPGGEGFRPHKYLLVLAVLDQIDSGQAATNCFRLDEGLRRRFSAHFARYARVGDSDRPWTPFFHLRSSGFWRLVPRAGKEGELAALSSVGGLGQLLEHVDHAELEGEAFGILSDSRMSQIVRQRVVLILEQHAQPIEPPSHVMRETPEATTAVGQGTSLFQHEQASLKQIGGGLGGLGRLIANVQLHDPQSNRYFECDAILAARTGLYVVELKHWSGQVRVQPNNWLLHGYRYQPDPHLVNGFKCKLLKSLCEHRLPTLPRLWVESIVVLTNPEATVEGADEPAQAAADSRSNLTFDSVDRFLSFLRKRDAIAAKRRLSDQDTRAVEQLLQSLVAPPPARQYTIPGYETVQYLTRRPEYLELLGRPLDGRTRGLERFRVFIIPSEGTAEEKERAKTRAWNTATAVERIGSHPHIQPVWTSRGPDGEIIERSAWSESGTLRDRLQDTEQPLTLAEAKEIGRGIALALAAAHEAGIIHRALRPEHVLMQNGVPKLTNFDLSYSLESGPSHVTVIPDPSQLVDDGYVAPELLAGQDIDEGTDLYALGVICYELLTRAKPFATTKLFAAQGGQLDPGQLERLRTQGVPEEIIATLGTLIVGDRAARQKDARRVADVLSAPSQLSLAALPAVNAPLLPGDHYDLYTIIELLGTGAESQVYRARTVRAEQVALKLFNHEVPSERIFAQRDWSIAVSSPYLVQSSGAMGQWNSDRFFLIRELVEGQTLRALINQGQRPSVECFRQVASGLLHALGALHSHQSQDHEPAPLVHGDVKPDNIILTKADEPKLTDFSVTGPVRVDLFAGTAGYVPPDKILGEEMAFAPDGDLFALGVTLWEWLFGQRPYENPTIDAAPPEAPPLDPDYPTGWGGWLRRAVATRQTERFSSAQEMRAAFETASVEPSVAVEVPPIAAPQITRREPLTRPQPAFVPTPSDLAAAGNPFVAYLNTLGNASAGNENAMAEAQSSNPLFERIHVDNPLTAYVHRQLVDERHNVILTGNAGDGKTTIASELHRTLTGDWLPALERVEVSRPPLVILKDMSELVGAKRSLALQEAARSPERPHLIVTNTGALIQSAKQTSLSAMEPAQVESELLWALEQDDAVPVLGGSFVLLNVGRTDSVETACGVLQRMVAPENWQACHPCPVASHCPMLRNVQLLQAHLDKALPRVELIYRRLYEYGVRLTLRQMTGHLAYSLTGGANCRAILSRSDLALDDTVVQALFSDLFFGERAACPDDAATQLLAVRSVRNAEFGVELDPWVEKDAWSGDGLGRWLGGSAGDILHEVTQAIDRDRGIGRLQARRLLYFFGELDSADERRFLAAFLRS
ncbi:MAG TPA: protein kinase, partial [Anaerolineae bacterium]|nr:protein kinase [Anaerolineae bacterium]